MYNVVKCDKNGMAGEMYLSTLRNGRTFHKTNSVTEVTTSLSQLVNGEYMFGNHFALTKFEQDLLNLTEGAYMFQRTSLIEFNNNLSALKGGNYLFSNTPLAKFTAELSKLESGTFMFENCKLTRFLIDLPSLQVGFAMFSGNKQLEEFRGCMPLLRNAYNMFHGCKLSPLSVMHIIEGIKDVRSEILAENGESALSSVEGIITIGINVTLTEGDNEGNKTILDAFAQEAGYEDFNTMNDRFTIDKGWTVTWQSQNSVSIVTPLTREKPLAIYARIEECDEEVAQFTNENQDRFFMIDYGFAVSGPKADTYTKFASFAEAVEYWNLIPYEREEGETDE